MSNKLELAASNEMDNKAMQSDLNTLKSHAAVVTQDLKNITQQLKERGMNETRYLKKRALEQLDEAQEFGTRNLQSLEERVRDRPAQSLALAFAAGLVASFFLGRRGRD